MLKKKKIIEDLIPGSRQMVAITKIVSDNPLSKQYWVEDGKIEKTPLASMYSGTAERIILPFEDSLELLESANKNTAFVWGVCDQPKVQIVPTIDEDLSQLKYGRNLNNFHYVEGQPAVMMIDYDHSDSAPKSYSHKDLRDALYSVIPELKQSAYFVRGSISSGISRKGENPKLKGFHFYVLVSDGSKIPEFAKQLVKALWIEGHGYIKVSRAGTPLKRTCIDEAVFSPERLDLQGKPIYDKAALDYEHQKCKFHEGIPFNCKPPEVDEERYNKLITEAEESKKEECRVVREIWLSNRVNKLVDKGHSKEDATNNVNRLLDSECKELYPEYELDFGFEKATVEDVLKDVEKYHNKSLYDPIEGREYGHKTAIFWANYNSNKPVIHSRARGIDITYFLKKSWQQELADHVKEMNKKNCKVMYGGKAYIAIDTVNIKGYKKYDFELESELAKHYSHLKIQTGVTDKNKPKCQNIITAWATNKDVRVRGNVVFKPIRVKYDPKAKLLFRGCEKFIPNSDDKSTFNTWRGFTVEPFRDRTKLDLIHWHMRNWCVTIWIPNRRTIGLYFWWTKSASSLATIPN